MCSPTALHPSDEALEHFLRKNGYDENIDATTARMIASDWLKCFPSPGVRSGSPSRKFEEEGIIFRPGQKQALTDFIFPPNDSS